LRVDVVVRAILESHDRPNWATVLQAAWWCKAGDKDGLTLRLREVNRLLGVRNRPEKRLLSTRIPFTDKGQLDPAEFLCQGAKRLTGPPVSSLHSRVTHVLDGNPFAGADKSRSRNTSTSLIDG